jgi:hypothetical protein
VFIKLSAGAAHALNPAFFFAGAAAHDADDFIVYNRRERYRHSNAIE